MAQDAHTPSVAKNVEHSPCKPPSCPGPPIKGKDESAKEVLTSLRGVKKEAGRSRDVSRKELEIQD